ncbi:MAG: regulatory protein RecX [Desulfuromonadales bacterium]|nr:MAG: regulatory protein RecX [Desulfuromonadales bacterium]
MERDRSPLGCALGILSRRDQSEAELARKLRRRGIGEVEIDAAIVRLRELGYLDDRRLAGRVAETALADGRMVGQRLRAELRRRGIPPTLADEALTRSAEGYDERLTVAELLGRKFPSFDPASAEMKEQRRIVGWFQRRGFSLAAILEALRVSADQ